MFKYTITRDANGNKIIRVSRKGHRAFTIQTNGNLPLTHKDGVGDWTKQEVAGYVTLHGSDAQKNTLNN